PLLWAGNHSCTGRLLDTDRAAWAVARPIPATAHRSASAFRLARPFSKSLPTMPSMLKNTCMILAKNGLGPCMAQVTFVDSPFGSNVNSTMLLASNGLTKSRLILTLDGGDVSAISMRPAPALPLLSQE